MRMAGSLVHMIKECLSEFICEKAFSGKGKALFFFVFVFLLFVFCSSLVLTSLELAM